MKPPKEQHIEDFRMLCLLNVEGKLFFSLISNQLTQHMVKNKIINTSIQKGCMEKVPGCWEHMAMVWEGLKEARMNKLDLVNIWLDIKNAYGSIPHQLIFFALQRYGIPDKWIKLIKNYYTGLWSRSFSETVPSGWHHHERGIFCWMHCIYYFIFVRHQYHKRIHSCVLC